MPRTQSILRFSVSSQRRSPLEKEPLRAGGRRDLVRLPARACGIGALACLYKRTQRKYSNRVLIMGVLRNAQCVLCVLFGCIISAGAAGAA